MAAYPNLSEDEKWALAHYIREKWVPSEVKKDASDEEVTAVCRTLSAPPKPPSIPVLAAMQFLVEDQPEQRRLEYTRYGAAYVSPTASAQNGAAVYTSYCSDCHGPNGAGLGAGDPDAEALGPHGSFPPYLYLRVNRLIPAQAGGTVEDFATRSMTGVHTTLPNMTAASTLTRKQWADLHAYVTGFDGEGEVIVGTKPAPTPQPLLGPDGQPVIGPDGQPVMQTPGANGATAAENSANQESAATPAGSPSTQDDAAPEAAQTAEQPADSAGSSNGQQ
jgi:mono/diheme cytochrome c family protein